MARDIESMQPPESRGVYYWPSRGHHLIADAREGAQARVKAITKLLKKKL